MLRRSRAREVALQLLFQFDNNAKITAVAVEPFAKERLRETPLVAFCMALYNGVTQNVKEIDKKLAAAAENLSARLVEGLQATDRGPRLVELGLMLATALVPVIGYDDAGKLAKEALKSGRTIRELALERGMDPAELDRLLDPEAMTEPGLEGGSAGS